MLFWIVSGIIATGAGVTLLVTLLRADHAPAMPATDVNVYRDQLAAVERDTERGVLAKDDAARLRIDLSRRILEHDAAGQSEAVPETGSGRFVALAAIVLAPVAALFLYSGYGAPGYPDMAIATRLERAQDFRASRPSQADAVTALVRLPTETDPAFADLVARLRTAVAQHPDDLQGLTLLARNEAVLGNLDAASMALARIIAVKGRDAVAADFAALADSYVVAANGYVSPEAEAALSETLARDAKNGTARFYMGLMWAQTGRPDLAFRLWRGLLEDGTENAPWNPVIREQIGMLAAAAGVDYAAPARAQSPAPSPGPVAADIAAAAEMTAEERQDMIRDMVEGLADRLARQGGSAAEWARLILALTQLGETGRARAIWAEAETVFAGRDTDLTTLRAAAEQAGIAP